MSGDRLYGPCCRGTPTGRCGAEPAHPYPGGAFCDEHAPWALAGQPRPMTPTQQKEQQ